MMKSQQLKMLIVLGLLIIFYYGSMISEKMNPFMYFYRTNTPKIFYVGRQPFILNDPLRLYQEQLYQYRIAPFLPTFHNHRLILKFNLTSVAIFLYGSADSFQGSNRHLRIQCFITTGRSPFNFNLYFHVQPLNATAIHLTLDVQTTALNPLLLITNRFNLVDRDDLTIHVQQMFSIDTQFRFTYRWLDQNITSDLFWPQWPLNRHQADTLLKNLRNNQTSCALVNRLYHQTTRDIFDNERTALIDWLDIQRPLETCSSMTKRRLVPFEKVSDPTICTPEFHQWVTDYQHWHQNLSVQINDAKQQQFIIRENIRFLLYESSDSGVADRFAHLMTTYLIAILTKRLLIFDSNWPELNEMMQSSLNYDRETVMPWFARTKLPVRRYRFAFDRLHRDYDYDREFTETILIFQGHTGGIVHMMVSKTSIYRTFLTEQLRMTAETMFGCLYHTLLIHRLSSFVDILAEPMSTDMLGHSPSQLLHILLSPNMYPIGIQVRTGDTSIQKEEEKQQQQQHRRWYYWWKRNPPKIPSFKSFDYFLSCARDFVHENRTFLTDPIQIPVLFLLSDDVRVRQFALNHSKFTGSCFQNNSLGVIASADAVLHIGLSSQHAFALRLALYDVFLFGLCEQHVITAESGFGNMAVFAALKRRKLYSISVTKHQTCQGPNRDISLVSSSYVWSGI